MELAILSLSFPVQVSLDQKDGFQWTYHTCALFQTSFDVFRDTHDSAAKELSQFRGSYICCQKAA